MPVMTQRPPAILNDLSRCLLAGVCLVAGISGRRAAGVDTAEVRSPSTRPNIVFAFADDWGRYAGIYAAHDDTGLCEVVRTPHIDRVGREGVMFTNAFVNAPSCTPCRSSLLSGQYFWRTGRGAILQGAVWDASIPAYPLLLQAAGYHIGHSAKVWSPGTPANAPYGAAQTAWNRRGGRFNRFSQQVSESENPAVTRQELLDEVRGNFQDFMEARTDDQPFCYWWGPTNTHRTWVQGSGKALWNIDPDSLRGKVPACMPDVPIVREDLSDYLGEVQAFDAGVGVLLAELEARGELGNTIVVISGDHGIPGVPHGKCNLYDLGTHVALAIRWPEQIAAARVVTDFVCLPDLAPTFLQAAGLPVPDVMTGRSLMPLLTSTASGQIDPLRDSVIVGRERHVASANDNLPYPMRAIRTKNFLYIRNFKPDRWPMGQAAGFGRPESPFPVYQELNDSTYAAFADMDASPTKAWIATQGLASPELRRYFDLAFGQRPAEELYDLRVDVHQMRNVADDPFYAEARVELTERLMGVLTSTGDPRVVGSGDAFDRPPFSDPPAPATPRGNPQRQQRGGAPAGAESQQQKSQKAGSERD